MSVKLKVLHGAIKKRGKWQLTVPIRKSPFVIGQASDCNMRCFGQNIRDYHCEILVEGYDVFICNLDRRSKTRINGHRLEGRNRFLAGDQLHVGRLAFELLVQLPPQNSEECAFDAFVSDMLLEADEADRRDRVRSPDERWYQFEPVPPQDPYEGMTPKERLLAKARKRLPPKQASPMKLPKRRYVAPSASHAVNESLSMYYQGIKPQVSGWSTVDE